MSAAVGGRTFLRAGRARPVSPGGGARPARQGLAGGAPRAAFRPHLQKTKMARSGESLMRRRMTKTNCPTVRSAGTRYFFLSMSGTSVFWARSTMTCAGSVVGGGTVGLVGLPRGRSEPEGGRATPAVRRRGVGNVESAAPGPFLPAGEVASALPPAQSRTGDAGRGV